MTTHRPRSMMTDGAPDRLSIFSPVRARRRSSSRRRRRRCPLSGSGDQCRGRGVVELPRQPVRDPVEPHPSLRGQQDGRAQQTRCHLFYEAGRVTSCEIDLCFWLSRSAGAPESLLAPAVAGHLAPALFFPAQAQRSCRLLGPERQDRRSAPQAAGGDGGSSDRLGREVRGSRWPSL